MAGNELEPKEVLERTGQARAPLISVHSGERGLVVEIAPDVGSYIFASSFTSVVFPAPFSPTIATTTPAGSRSETSSRTSRDVPG